MTQDIVDLIDFYATPLGQSAAASIRATISELWPENKIETFLGIGYPLPFIPNRSHTYRTLVFMAAHQGVIYWPDGDKNICCLINEDALPIPNDSVERILVIHSLEHTEYTRPYLRELRRVLTGNGRILVIVPNRRGLWARIDETPFGHGNPYTMTQLSQLLKENQFTPLRSARALYSIPGASHLSRNMSIILEKVGPTFFPKFSGLVCIEASKQIYCSYKEKSPPFILGQPKPSRA